MSTVDTTAGAPATATPEPAPASAVVGPLAGDPSMLGLASFIVGSIALGLGSVMSFALMLMASRVGEPEALRLHATELLMMLGTAIVMLVERPASVPAQADVPAEPLPIQEPQLLNNG